MADRGKCQRCCGFNDFVVRKTSLYLVSLHLKWPFFQISIECKHKIWSWWKGKKEIWTIFSECRYCHSWLLTAELELDAGMYWFLFCLKYRNTEIQKYTNTNIQIYWNMTGRLIFYYHCLMLNLNVMQEYIVCVPEFVACLTFYFWFSSH